MNKKIFLYLCIILTISVNSCKSYKVPETYTYKQPVQLNDELISVSLEGHENDLNTIKNLFEDIYTGRYGEIHSVIAASGNYIFLEEYLPGKIFFGPKTMFNANKIHNMASVTKSVCSILIGIAIDKGFISSIDNSIMEYFPDYDAPDREEKAKITLRHLLTMTAGLNWDEHSYPYTSSKNDINQFYRSSDPIGFVLNKKISRKPGDTFNYNGGCTNILGEIIFRSSGKKADKFCEEYLFGPLGIKDEKWITLGNNTVYTSGDLKIKPRDLLKLGLLYLNKGVWEGKRIVSEEWVNESTSIHISLSNTGFDGYGYQWWINKLNPKSDNPLHLFSARGWGGQDLYVIPDNNFIVVLTGGNYENFYRSDKIMYLLQTLKIWDELLVK